MNLITVAGGLVLGIILGNYFAQKFKMLSVGRIIAVSVFIPLLIIVSCATFGIGMIDDHRYDTNYMTLSLPQVERHELSTSDRFAISLGKTIALIGLGAVAYGVTFGRRSLKIRREIKKAGQSTAKQVN